MVFMFCNQKKWYLCLENIKTFSQTEIKYMKTINLNDPSERKKKDLNGNKIMWLFYFFFKSKHALKARKYVKKNKLKSKAFLSIHILHSRVLLEDTFYEGVF